MRIFKETSRTLKRMEKVQMNIPVPVDKDGFLDRQCPHDECSLRFKVNGECWSRRTTPNAFCPLCGHEDKSGKWFTAEQAKYFKGVAFSSIRKPTIKALRHDVREFNRRHSSGGMVQMQMRVDSAPFRSPLPPEVDELIKRTIVCSACDSRYAVVGASFFCPCCGYRDDQQIFGDSMDRIRGTLDEIPRIRELLPDRDTAESIARDLIHDALKKAVTCFQVHSESLYSRFPDAKRPRPNAFQNINDGSELWETVTGREYRDHIGDGDLTVLARAFQQRHLLVHKNGFVDARYIEKCGDERWLPDQRLVLSEREVREYLRIIGNLADRMAADAPRQP